jgi:glycogen(starch) synthase
MLGWELPPFFAGGVGMACYHLTKALCKLGQEITYVMPFGPDQAQNDYMKILIAENMGLKTNFNLKGVNTLIKAYTTPECYLEELKQYESNNCSKSRKSLYGPNIFEEAILFSQRIKLIAQMEDFDVIHAHDHWTFMAGLAAKEVSGKPLIVHVHITEFDKTGGSGVNQRIYEMEKYGLSKADIVIANSNFIKRRLMNDYCVPEHKIRVVHNAAEDLPTIYHDAGKIKEKDKIVLFIGRVTLQKGPDYFIDAAKKVLEKEKNVKFILAGSGDMLGRMIQKVADMGMADKFIFPGFISREEVAKLNRMADVFVMPSVSEPFGIVPLEAMSQETPTIISKQSGVSEVLQNALKVDFWDINDLAAKIISLLKYSNLHNELKTRGFDEVKNMTWDKPAQKCIDIYKEVAGGY